MTDVSRTSNLGVEQLRILRHMLGIDRPDVMNPKPYRDYYCANPGDQALHELARLGAVRLYDTRGGYEWFTCTEVGRAAAIASHRIIRYSRGAMRYSRFLDMREVCPDLTFRQFLTDPQYREAV